jgi:hypothetical protein
VNKFAGAAAGAKYGLQRDQAIAAKDQAKDQAKAGADAEAEQAMNTPGFASFTDVNTAQITIAGLIVDAEPREGVQIAPFESLNAAHFLNAQKAVEVMQKRFDKFMKELVADIRSASYIKDYEKNEVQERFEDTNPKREANSEELLHKNGYGERNAWMLALTRDDPNIGTRAIVQMIGKISKDHEDKNGSGADKTKYFATGLNLVNVAGFQMRAVQSRLEGVIAMLDELESEPRQETAPAEKPGADQVDHAQNKEVLTGLRKYK